MRYYISQLHIACINRKQDRQRKILSTMLLDLQRYIMHPTNSQKHIDEQITIYIHKRNTW